MEEKSTREREIQGLTLHCLDTLKIALFLHYPLYLEMVPYQNIHFYDGSLALSRGGEVDPENVSDWYSGDDAVSDRSTSTRAKSDNLKVPADEKWVLANTVQKSLVNIDDILESMLVDSYEVFKPFVPKEVLDTVLHGKQSNFVVPGNKNQKVKVKSTQEVTSGHPDFTVMASILGDEKMITHIRSSQSKVEGISGSLALLVKILKQRVVALKIFKEEIRMLYQGLAKKFPESLSAAKELWEDYDKFSERSHCSPYKRNCMNLLYYSDKSQQYSIVYRSPICDWASELKLYEIRDKEKCKNVLEQILDDMEKCTGLLHTFLKDSLNQKILQNFEEDQLKMEIEKIKGFCKSSHHSSANFRRSTATTLLFTMMRILPKFDQLTKILQEGTKYLVLINDDLLNKKKKHEKLIKKLSKSPLSNPTSTLVDKTFGEKIVQFFETQHFITPEAASLIPDMSAFPIKLESGDAKLN